MALKAKKTCLLAYCLDFLSVKWDVAAVASLCFTCACQTRWVYAVETQQITIFNTLDTFNEISHRILCALPRNLNACDVHTRAQLTYTLYAWDSNFRGFELRKEEKGCNYRTHKLVISSTHSFEFFSLGLLCFSCSCSFGVF